MLTEREVRLYEWYLERGIWSSLLLCGPVLLAAIGLSLGKAFCRILDRPVKELVPRPSCVRRAWRRLTFRDLEERAAARAKEAARVSIVMEREAGLLFYGVFMLSGYWERGRFSTDVFVSRRATSYGTRQLVRRDWTQDLTGDYARLAKEARAYLDVTGGDALDALRVTEANEVCVQDVPLINRLVGIQLTGGPDGQSSRAH